MPMMREPLTLRRLSSHQVARKSLLQIGWTDEEQLEALRHDNGVHYLWELFCCLLRLLLSDTFLVTSDDLSDLSHHAGVANVGFTEYDLQAPDLVRLSIFSA
jgi:hypothetical protein